MKVTRKELEGACERVIQEKCEDVDSVMWNATKYLAALVSGDQTDCVEDFQQVRLRLMSDINLEYE
ncbi:MAG: hypothetical protein PQJ44_07070 [Sphaerochaetaceae bacterium]|nr:hypothetical protein [Sphaerochaetaceae bacterium]